MEVMHWGLYRDDSNPNTYVENFTVESWVERMRQYERMTKDDQKNTR